MNINTKKEAEEFFHHNPEDKRIYFALLTESDINRLEIDIGYDVDILTIEENK